MAISMVEDFLPFNPSPVKRIKGAKRVTPHKLRKLRNPYGDLPSFWDNEAGDEEEEMEEGKDDKAGDEEEEKEEGKDDRAAGFLPINKTPTKQTKIALRSVEEANSSRSLEASRPRRSKRRRTCNSHVVSSPEL